MLIEIKEISERRPGAEISTRRQFGLWTFKIHKQIYMEPCHKCLQRFKGKLQMLIEGKLLAQFECWCWASWKSRDEVGCRKNLKVLQGYKRKSSVHLRAFNYNRKGDISNLLQLVDTPKSRTRVALYDSNFIQNFQGKKRTFDPPNLCTREYEIFKISWKIQNPALNQVIPAAAPSKN